MFQRVNYTQFFNAFASIGRERQFPNSLDVLFDYLEELEEETGEAMELDVVGLCCEYAEDTLENVLQDYSLTSLEELQDKTLAIDLENGSVLYKLF